MMWIKISEGILRFRYFFILLIFGITLWMAYKAQQASLSYDYTSAVPENDEELKYFKNFQKLFGQDANLMVIGMKDKKILLIDKFIGFQRFTHQLKKIKGVSQVIALPQLQYLLKDTTHKKFTSQPVFKNEPRSQSELDSLLRFAGNLLFYERQIFQRDNGANIILLTLEKEYLDSYLRTQLIESIKQTGENFSKNTGIELHYGGIPFLRSVMSGEVARELKNLLLFSVIATGILLFLFFRSWTAVLFPLLIIGILIVWCVGLIVLFGYKINILTALMPPLLVVIGIPNCVYLLNRYHQEYRLLKNKREALGKIIRKIGIVSLMTNATTAAGFAVFIFMDVQTLKEFGVISSICIACTFVVSIILLPIIYSFLPAPRAKDLKHLDRKPLLSLLRLIEYTAFHQRTLVFILALVIAVFSLWGIFQMKALSYMTENIPYRSKPKQDLLFFEKNFRGVMPLEIVVDTKKKRGVLRLSSLMKIEKLEKSLDSISLIAKPLSVLSLIKASKQAFYNNLPEFYELPNNQEFPFILNYLSGGQDSSSKKLLQTFVDSTGQKMRISLKVADVGSERLDSLVKKVIRPKLDQMTADQRMEAHITGTTYIFIKGNVYLMNSLVSSIALAIVLIALIMAMLFASIRVIFISLCTNLLPLGLTAALMGYFGIPLKPSSAIIFSIAFGIAVDTSIHFLARYRQELRVHKHTVPVSVKISILETGAGMFYTSIILFFGFIVFVFSDFDGTIVLGGLTSTTLLMAMFSNLILLPCMLLALDKGRLTNAEIPLIEFYDEPSVYEHEDSEIDLDLLKIPNNLKE